MGLLILLVSCGKVQAVPDADAPGPDAYVCTAEGCDDGDPCTVDSCAGNACVHESHGQQVFGLTGAVETFAASACARTITIDAVGARGGNAALMMQPGGNGAHVKGDFAIPSGTAIMVLVGAQGGDASGIGGGGGGSFAWSAASPAAPYLVAGGGGGAGYNSAGQPGLTTQKGGNGGAATGGAGTNGSGGVAPTPVTNWAAGGAGWVSDGAGGGGANATPCGLSTGGKAPKNGGAGGVAGGMNAAAVGGFGGGGGAQGQCNVTGGGGGGGYSGGGGGIDNGSPNFTGGGGGGSFNAGMNPVNMAGTNAGPGSVTISW